MKKMLLLCTTMLITACSIQINDALDEPQEYCYLRNIYYGDACGSGKYATEDNCNRWKQISCGMWVGNDCVHYDSDVYFQVEECTEVYKK